MRPDALSTLYGCSLYIARVQYRKTDKEIRYVLR
jgi:hypothetical protein